MTTTYVDDTRIRVSNVTCNRVHIVSAVPANSSRVAYMISQDQLVSVYSDLAPMLPHKRPNAVKTRARIE